MGLLNIGMMIAGVGRGLEILSLGVIQHKSPAGVTALAGKGIEKPKDLEGKTYVTAPASGEHVGWKAFVKITGIDESKVKIVYAEPRVWDAMLLEGKVDVRGSFYAAVLGDEIFIDWDGTSDQVDAAFNGPMPTTKAMAYLAVRCAITAPIPNCEGYMRAIKVNSPLGSIVNPIEPAACGARGIICFRMFDTLLGAFAQILPDIPAANEGGSSAPHIAGRHQDNKPFLISGGLMGCWGGSRKRDGYEGVTNPAANLGNTPIELLESQQPVEITRYSFVQNSGGPGRSRGGNALMRGYRLLADKAVLIMRSDRRKVLPYGLEGGLPGTPSWNIINSGSEKILLPVCPMERIPMNRDDEFVHIQAGGGGYGNPLDRDPKKVLHDALNELITLEYAFDVYGVVIRDWAVDQKATEIRRAELGKGGETQNEYLTHFYRTIGIDPMVSEAD